jgi:hypothetical protein
MDMLHCYAKGVREHFPKAQIVYDRFHLMVMAGEAVDEVRRSLQRQGADLKGALRTLRGNPWNLKPDELETRTRLARKYKPLGRALALRAALQDVYEASTQEGPATISLTLFRASSSVRVGSPASKDRIPLSTAAKTSGLSSSGSPRNSCSRTFQSCRFSSSVNFGSSSKISWRLIFLFISLTSFPHFARGFCLSRN